MHPSLVWKMAVKLPRRCACGVYLFTGLRRLWQYACAGAGGTLPHLCPISPSCLHKDPSAQPVATRGNASSFTAPHCTHRLRPVGTAQATAADMAQVTATALTKQSPRQSRFQTSERSRRTTAITCLSSPTPSPTCTGVVRSGLPPHPLPPLRACMHACMHAHAAYSLTLQLRAIDARQQLKLIITLPLCD
jgi:hypothetical protein